MHHDAVSDSTATLIMTLAWVALVGVLLGLFGRSEGGAWSIAGDVARGVRSWAGQRRTLEAASSGSPSPRSRATSPSTSPAPASPAAASPSDRAELEEL